MPRARADGASHTITGIIAPGVKSKGHFHNLALAFSFSRWGSNRAGVCVPLLSPGHTVISSLSLSALQRKNGSGRR
ncbi:hypothetical protein ACFLTX_00120 [Chloroflexota bacterium]